MKIRTFFYVIRQGIKSTFKNKWFTLASIATIGACLFLFGVGYSIVMNLQYMVKSAEEGVSVSVLFDFGITDDRIAAIGDMITSHPAVAKVEYISGDEAWESFKESYLQGYADGFTENPLADSMSYEIYLKDVEQQASLVAWLQTIEGVRKVNRSDITANMLSGMNSLIAYVSVGIIIILLLVSIFLISNTVTIGISVRKEEITIMKYIGATDFFVRSPFVIEGILIGAVGALIPLGAIWLIYDHALDYILSRFSVLSTLLKFMSREQIFDRLFPVCMAVGVGIGFLGSFVTVRRHLKV